jgi:hypothetical protein
VSEAVPDLLWASALDRSGNPQDLFLHRLWYMVLTTISELSEMPAFFIPAMASLFSVITNHTPFLQSQIDQFAMDFSSRILCTRREGRSCLALYIYIIGFPPDPAQAH